MPRARLPVAHLGDALAYTDPATPGATVRVPSLRVMVTVLFGPDPAPGAADPREEATALLDTGAPFGIMNHGTWQLYEGQGLLHPLTRVGGPERLSIGGNRGVPYRLGWMWLGVVPPKHAPQRQPIRAARVVFQLPERQLGLPWPFILGTHSGVLDGRWFYRRPVAVGGVENRYDIGGRYGQEWWLQDEAPRPEHLAAR